MDSRIVTVRRRHLDRRITPFRQLGGLPPVGWLAEIRRTLGKSAIGIAKKLGVSQAALSQAETSELAGTITLNSLRKYADALDCDLVYALVPRAGSLETQLQARAQKVAAQIVRGTSHTMSLEDQSTGTEDLDQQVQDLASELVRTLSPELWKDPE